jgi:L-2-hydroxyglutarate oxidase
VGGGIVGLATADQLLARKPRLRLIVLEKEPELATHQTAHNSGVLHAGLYYAPGSRKARLCREGAAALQRFAEERGIPIERRGQLVVAVVPGELAGLLAIKERALQNGVPGLEEVGPQRMREIEPHAAGIRGLWSPTTAVVDFRRVALAVAQEVRARGGALSTGREVMGIRRLPDGILLWGPAGETRTASVIACAGLQSDRVAAMTQDAGQERVVPFRGDYCTLRPSARGLVRGLIYPVPDPRFPFLGVHFTRRVDGEVWAGPNAVLAFAREGYRRWDVSPRDVWETLSFAGFRRFARRHLATGIAEMWRDWSKRAFARALARYVPEIRAKDLDWGPAGVRAQALRSDGTLVEDFSIGESDRVIHLRNAPSPAATASLAIGRELAELAISRFGLD